MNRFLKTGMAFAAALLLSAASFLTPVAQAASTSTSLNNIVLNFKVTATKYYNNMGYSSNHYAYTEADIKALAIVIHLEVRGQPYKAQLAVGDIVMNRVLSPGYPGATVLQVVTRPNQFCYNPKVTPDATCMQAARDVLVHEVWVVPQNTYFFRATASKANWGRHTYLEHIGATAFYTDKYAGRSNLKTVPQALFQRVYKWPEIGCVPSARVKKVQLMLNALGYKSTADGWFGYGTQTALKSFQKAMGLKQDGIAGPTTLKTLIKKYGLTKYLKL